MSKYTATPKQIETYEKGLNRVEADEEGLSEFEVEVKPTRTDVGITEPSQIAEAHRARLRTNANQDNPIWLW
jgi:hypothetical protein